MRSEVLGWMLGCNTDDLAIVRLIAESVQFHKEPYNFYTEVCQLEFIRANLLQEGNLKNIY